MCSWTCKSSTQAMAVPFMITMKDYLKEALAKSGMDTTQSSPATPVLTDLFEENKCLPALEKDEAESFHRSVTAKLL